MGYQRELRPRLKGCVNLSAVDLLALLVVVLNWLFNLGMATTYAI